MDHYSSKFPLLFAPEGVKRWAITIGQSTWYSVPENQVDDAWRRHEEAHKKQWREEGRIKFAVKYLFYLARYGYQMNPYEVAARKAE